MRRTPARDGLAIQETKADLRAVLKEFISLPVEAAREKYNLGPDSRDWQVALAQKDVRSSKLSEARIQPIAYRPFDTRFTYYTGVSRGVICMPRPEVMQHMIAGGNQAICFMRNNREQIVSNFFVARHLVDKTILSSADNANVAPLYLYPDSRSPKLFDTDTDKSSDAPGGRRPNFSTTFIADISARLNMRFMSDGRGDLQETFGSEDVFDYMYAVFYSPAYRARYVEFLTSDFPYLPLTTNTDLFRALCQLGNRLIAFHTMNLSHAALSTYPVTGNNQVEKIEYRVTPEEQQSGRVYINGTQYIEGVPTDVWEFQVGGYQVCHKWLKDRRGRALSYEDIRQYHPIVTALAETISLMEQIDETIEEHGGWPIV